MSNAGYVRVCGAVLFLLLITLLTNQRVMACSCVRAKPCEAYGWSDAVFVGTVASFTERNVRVTNNEGELEFETTRRLSVLQVEEAFTNLNGVPEVFIETDVSTSCALPLTKGERYLIYASRGVEPDRYYTGLCSGTRPAAQAEEDLAYLRTLPRETKGTTLSGFVRYNRRADYYVALPSSVTTVVAEREGQRFEARLNQEGFYRFPALAAGKYSVRVLLPDEFTTSDDYYADFQEEIDNKDHNEVEITGHGCLNKQFFIIDNGRISGKLTDDKGEPAANVQVNLIYISETGEIVGSEDDITEDMSRRTDAEGNYSFKGLPPGRYLIGVRLDEYVNADGPDAAYPRTYYPGVPDQKRAVVVALAQGESVEKRDFQLLPRFAERKITGRVVRANGKPAKNVKVRYIARTPDRKKSDLVVIQTDDNGRFSFIGYERNAYLVGAFIESEDEQIYAREIEVGPTGEVKALKLVLNQAGTSERDYDAFQK